MMAMIIIAIMVTACTDRFKENLEKEDKAANLVQGNPAFNPPEGSYAAAQNVEILSSTSGDWFCYTTNDSVPSCGEDSNCGNGTKGNGLAVTGNLTLKAIGCNGTKKRSAVSSGVYVIDTSAPTTPSNFAAPLWGFDQIYLSWIFSGDDNTASSQIVYEICQSSVAGGCDTFTVTQSVTGQSNTIVSGLSALTTYYFRIRAKDKAGNLSAPSAELTAGTTSGGTTAGSAPTVLSSTPADTATNVAPCSGNPCKAKIVIVFSERMNTTLTQILTTEIFDGTSYVTVPNTNTTFTWSTTTLNGDTLTINISWLWFPENSQIRYTLAASGLKDVANKPIAAQVQRSFTTTTANQAFPIADTAVTNCFDSSAQQPCPVAGFPGQDAEYVNLPNARSFTGPTPHATYTNDVTTRDNSKGLVWKTCTEGLTAVNCITGSVQAISWSGALNQCSALNLSNSASGYGGRTNWRLPTSGELETLPNYSVTSPSSDAGYFPLTWNYAYWTASGNLSSGGVAWNITFVSGNASLVDKTTNLLVRCVSAGAVTNQAFADNNDGTITDNTTGLRWQKCSRGQTNDVNCGPPAATVATWNTALQYCDTLALGAFGNSSNWRLPSFNELKSLVDKSRNSPSIKIAYFPGMNGLVYWSSSTYVASISNAWTVNFSDGSGNVAVKLGSAQQVRCVATGP